MTTTTANDEFLASEPAASPNPGDVVWFQLVHPPSLYTWPAIYQITIHWFRLHQSRHLPVRSSSFLSFLVGFVPRSGIGLRKSLIEGKNSDRKD